MLSLETKKERGKGMGHTKILVLVISEYENYLWVICTLYNLSVLSFVHNDYVLLNEKSISFQLKKIKGSANFIFFTKKPKVPENFILSLNQKLP